MRTAGRVPRGYSKVGDDVAVVPRGKTKLVLKVDMLVEHTDVPPGMSYREAARKAVAMCVSDFAAKGVKPDSFLVSLGVRKGVSRGQVQELADGLRDAEREWKVKLVGGDTNEANELIVDCAMAGFAKQIVPRSGASSGDALVVTGHFGLPSSGLRLLGGRAKAKPVFREAAVRSVLRPSPSLKVGLALAPYMSSAMDSSDGLARSIHTLASQSGVGFELNTLPAGRGVSEFAKENGLDPEKLVLEGGEEYVIVATVSGDKLAPAKHAVKRVGGQLIQIGVATSKKGKVVLNVNGRRRPIRDRGWTHLRHG